MHSHRTAVSGKSCFHSSFPENEAPGDKKGKLLVSDCLYMEADMMRFPPHLLAEGATNLCTFRDGIIDCHFYWRRAKECVAFLIQSVMRSKALEVAWGDTYIQEGLR